MTEEKIDEFEKKSYENALFQSKMDYRTGNRVILKIYAILKNQGFSDLLVVEDESFQKYNVDRLRFYELVKTEDWDNYKRRLTPEEFLFLKDYVAFGKFLFEQIEEKKAHLLHPKQTAAYGKLCKNIIGQEKMKHTLFKLNSVYQYVKKREQYQLATDSIHKVLAFIGPPGTGKTTAAKYFGEMMSEENLLSGGKIAYVTGTQLKAGYIGQTSDRVHQIFHKHDIIIIDEAYSLVNYNAAEKTDSFSQEALAQLCIEVEEHSQDKMIIFAGYGGGKNEKYNKMEKFMAENPGIASRITFTVPFDPYTVEEMLSIFQLLAVNNNYALEEGWENILTPFFKKRILCENFGNGREARRLLETAMTFAAENFINWNCDAVFQSEEEKQFKEKEKLSVLRCVDIQNAAMVLQE